MVHWLADSGYFPPAVTAGADGLIAAGLGLTPDKVLKAYRRGIFPWGSDGDVVFWWSPDPRMVLAVEDFKISRSLRKTMASGKFDVRCDTAFREVMASCAKTARRGQEGTWITPAFVDAYSALHLRGFAHSVEAWRDGLLVGGLYGLQIDRFFFGESMFAHERDASKVALAHLVARLQSQGITHIDCQQETAHLASLGARPVSRRAFLQLLEERLGEESREGAGLWC